MADVSIVISSYNYARYLRACIDSALRQAPAADVEVVVVDDGSTDESPEIIRAYGDRIISHLGPNQGQAGAWNAGLALSSGDVVVFLDLDDVLMPEAASIARQRFTPEVVHVHWPMLDIDGFFRRASGNGHAARAGSLWEPARRTAASRACLDARDAELRECLAVVEFPDGDRSIPAEAYRTCPDDYLTVLAPLFGGVGHVEQALTEYRTHGANSMNVLEFDVDAAIRLYRLRSDAILHHAGLLGLPVDMGGWDRVGWDWLQMVRRVRDVLRELPAGGSLRCWMREQVRWGLGTPQRICPFPDADGQYAGPFADDRDALERRALPELGALRISL